MPTRNANWRTGMVRVSEAKSATVKESMLTINYTIGAVSVARRGISFCSLHRACFLDCSHKILQLFDFIIRFRQLSGFTAHVR